MGRVIKSFKELVVWQKAHRLVLKIFKVTKYFPPEEKFGIVSQMRRAAYSIPTNIVEGHSRNSRREFLHFLSIAKGSLEELRYFNILTHDLNYIDKKIFTEINDMVEELSKILFGFTKSLREIKN